MTFCFIFELLKILHIISLFIDCTFNCVKTASYPKLSISDSGKKYNRLKKNPSTVGQLQLSEVRMLDFTVGHSGKTTVDRMYDDNLILS